MTARDLARQWASLADGDQPADAVAGLECPLLIAHGTADDVIPVAHGHQLAARAGSKADLILIADADHLFSAHRSQLVETVVGWLTETLPELAIPIW